MKNEYFFEKNCAIFQSELKMITVWAVIALTKENNWQEKTNVFKSDYTEESLKMQKKIKATLISRVKYFMSESDNSDINRVLKQRQHLKKNMIIDKNKEKDIDQLIFSFSQESDLIITLSALKSRDNLKKHLNNT